MFLIHFILYLNVPSLSNTREIRGITMVYLQYNFSVVSDSYILSFRYIKNKFEGNM